MINSMYKAANTNTLLSAEQLNALPLDNPFWQFSLLKWQQPSFQEALLTLQNTQDFKINQLLFAMWLGLEKKRIKPLQAQIALNTEAWHTTVVAPLRGLRQSLPKHSVRASVQKAELAAEQIEQALLFELATKATICECNALTVLIDNLFASRVPESHLLLFIQTCLPDFSRQEIQSQLDEFTRKLATILSEHKA